MILNIFILLGGIAVFLTGLKLVSDNFTLLIGEKISEKLKKLSSSSVGCALLGAGATALTQSSVAVNMIAVSFAEKGIMSLKGACAAVVGTNVGTTITAQLTSLSGGNGFVVPIGYLIAFFGVILREINNDKLLPYGNAVAGLGFIFIGINVMTVSMQSFYSEERFLNFFLIKSPPILLLNGFFITSVCQSSSVVTSMLVILSGGKIITVERAIYMILGANVGSCTAVIFASKEKNACARKVAYFNLVFNLLGAVILFIPMIFAGDIVSAFLVKISGSEGKAVADFHTLFNLIFGILSLPVMEKLTKITDFLVRERNLSVKKRTA